MANLANNLSLVTTTTYASTRLSHHTRHPHTTPAGESCGLVKNLSLMTHVTTDEEDGPIARAAFMLGCEPVGGMSGCETHTRGAALVFLNGNILGMHRRPQTFVRTFRWVFRWCCCVCLYQEPCQLWMHALGCYPWHSAVQHGVAWQAVHACSQACSGWLKVPLLRCCRELRRRGLVHEFVHLHLQNDACYISCDGGRVCRPLIICDK